jgi:nucleoside-diphosphate-sugar epimerase
MVPIIGDGAGIWSFLHISDAAAATVAALERGAPGVYNVVDDDPASVAEWLPFLAAAVGARVPYRVPVWLGRLAAGEVGLSTVGCSVCDCALWLAWVCRVRRAGGEGCRSCARAGNVRCSCDGGRVS